MHTFPTENQSHARASSYPEGGVAPLRHTLAMHTYLQKRQMHAQAPQVDLLGWLATRVAKVLAYQRSMSICAIPSSSYGADTVTNPKLA